MIDPVIFTINIGDFAFSLHWYAVLAVTGIVVGTWLAARELRWRGGDPSLVWDGLAWVAPAGILGGRVWYVLNDIAGGGTRYLDNPISMINIPEGGMHYYGGLLFGAVAAYLFVRHNKMDMWRIIDSVAPSLLIGQAVARPGNFINQELYGPPTDLPWGISIDAANRMPPWNDLTLYPEATTRFHPAFAYEMIWNFITGELLLWLGRRFPRKMKPGAVFAAWLVLAGVGREVIEFFRPDQPRVPGTDISYTRIVAGLMIIAGVIWLLIRYQVIRLSFLSPGPESYAVAPPSTSQAEGDEHETDEGAV
jgi:phosphatidylglycerol:prolipoprotein diacylglycerol transferase